MHKLNLAAESSPLGFVGFATTAVGEMKGRYRREWWNIGIIIMVKSHIVESHIVGGRL